VKFKVSAVLALLVLFTYSANAAPVSKVVKVVAAKPIATITLSGAAGDQFFGVTTSPESIVYVGTVESGTTIALGLSDGYVSAISPTGTRQWELQLGTALDDIATSILRDKVGNYWVLGATSQPIPPVVIAPPAPSLNPDSATVETTTAPVTFNRALLWKLSNSGALLATYQYDSPQELYPKTLTLGATALTITGDLADGSSFSLQSDFNGVFTGFAPLTIKSAVAPAITITKAGTYTYKSFISKGAIIGIPTWKPKTPTPVIVEYNKANTLKSAFSLKGNVTNRIWQAGIGLVVISDLGSSTAIYALPLVP
jgi:hypothetical protein